MIKCLYLSFLTSVYSYAAPVDCYELIGANAYSNYGLQVNVLSQKLVWNSFYTLGNPVSTKAIYSHGNVLASFNTLIQLPLFMGMNWTEQPNSSTLPIHSFLNLINGEIGFDFGQSSIGILNSFQWYFTRAAYHQAGFIYRCNFKKFGEYSFAVLEEDRLNYSRPKLIFQLGVNFGEKQQSTN